MPPPMTLAESQADDRRQGYRDGELSARTAALALGVTPEQLGTLPLETDTRGLRVTYSTDDVIDLAEQLDGADTSAEEVLAEEPAAVPEARPEDTGVRAEPPAEMKPAAPEVAQKLDAAMVARGRDPGQAGRGKL